MLKRRVLSLDPFRTVNEIATSFLHGLINHLAPDCCLVEPVHAEWTLRTPMEVDVA